MSVRAHYRTAVVGYGLSIQKTVVPAAGLEHEFTSTEECEVANAGWSRVPMHYP